MDFVQSPTPDHLDDMYSVDAFRRMVDASIEKTPDYFVTEKIVLYTLLQNFTQRTCSKDICNCYDTHTSRVTPTTFACTLEDAISALNQHPDTRYSNMSEAFIARIYPTLLVFLTRTLWLDEEFANKSLEYIKNNITASQAEF